jgi:hypothetical protein
MDLNRSLHGFFVNYEVDEWLAAQGQDDGAAMEQIMATFSNHQDFAECKQS